MARRKHIRGRSGGGGSIRLSGMPSGETLHFDARDLVSGTHYDPGTSRVSAWPSRNGAVTMAQATASKQPLYQATGFGSSPGVLYDGSDDKLWSAFSGITTQSYSLLVGLKYTAGAANYHQASFGGSASGAAETNSDDYFNGMGMRPIAPNSRVDSFTVYNGPPPSGILYNAATHSVMGAKSAIQALAASWGYDGSNNIVKGSVAGNSVSMTLAIKTSSINATLQSASLGAYSSGVLEGQLTEVRVWGRTLSQIEINRATRVMNGRLA